MSDDFILWPYILGLEEHNGFRYTLIQQQISGHRLGKGDDGLDIGQKASSTFTVHSSLKCS